MAYILTNKVTHARLLPHKSAHAFNYPTLALLLPLRALESHGLDLARGWVFGYGGTWGRVLGIRPEAYLYEELDGLSNFKGNDEDAVAVRETILGKLRRVVSKRGYVGDDLYDAWMLTMPSYLGFEGINPLSVYFCYKSDGMLWLVVLEIHNTFSERHVHVLCVNEDEDPQAPHGYDHSWTFARQFHVSPFNDRSGNYSCAIIRPPHSPFASSGEETLKSIPPLPTVRIHLYTKSAPDNPSQLKLTATLRAKEAVALSTFSLFSALARYPFTLFLSLVRITYHAWVLHYKKRLDVYVRPEPAAGEDGANDVEERLPQSTNMPEGGPGGGVGWQREGPLERYARELTEQFLSKRAIETNISIILESANPSIGRKYFRPSAGESPESIPTKKCTLTISYRTPRVFTLLLSSPSSGLFLAAARDAERILGISDEALFCEVVTLRSDKKNRVGRSHTLIRLLREWPIPPSLKAAKLDPLVHPLDIDLHEQTSYTRIFKNTLAIATLHFLVALERYIFTLANARFVRGDEPWLVWERTEVALLKSDQIKRSAGSTNGGLDGDTVELYGSRSRDGAGIGSVRREVGE